jgi:hypothetical protein
MGSDTTHNHVTQKTRPNLKIEYSMVVQPRTKYLIHPITELECNTGHHRVLRVSFETAPLHMATSLNIHIITCPAPLNISGLLSQSRSRNPPRLRTLGCLPIATNNIFNILNTLHLLLCHRCHVQTF